MRLIQSFFCQVDTPAKELPKKCIVELLSQLSLAFHLQKEELR